MVLERGVTVVKDDGNFMNICILKAYHMRHGDERLYWVGFSVFPGIGPKKFEQLLTAFGSAESAWNAKEKEFEAVVKPAITKKFLAFKNEFFIESYQRELEKKEAWYVILTDNEYPRLLKEIENPPFVLYGKGDISALSLQKTIGIVGTRKITSYGRQVTEMITAEMVSAGYCIVSGLAMGVDAVAHKTAIENNGKTIAVLGCGVDCCSPASNAMLYRQIIESGGAIISEFPLSMSPSIGSFPSRNRIIAGLSHVVLVTEGAADSGALITASNAAQQQKAVFAVPGPITSQLSKGPNILIQNGARLVTSAEEILVEVGIKSIKGTKSMKGEVKGETEDEKRIIDLLQNESLHFDEIVKQTGFDVTKISILLSMMELKGLIHQEKSTYNL